MRPVDTKNKAAPESVAPGPAPMLQWLPIDALRIDDRYQRDLKIGNWKAIRRIATAFRWSMFSPVFVAPIEGGKYAVIDGQHRIHAAAICGISEVPCQIVQMTLEEQAASFAAVNGLVTKVTPWQIYRAALAANEDWAHEIRAICEDANCRLMEGNSSTDLKKPGEVYALQLIRHFHRRGQGKLATFALAALRKSEGGAEAAVWSNEVLRPLLSAVTDRPWLLKQNADLSSFLDGFDIWKAIDDAADQVKAARRRGSIGVSKYDFAAAEIGDALDRTFPPKGKNTSRPSSSVVAAA